ncbi:hypothetical protein JCM10207_003442 [Rhodosporidiobolus poonsookiae]
MPAQALSPTPPSQPRPSKVAPTPGNLSPPSLASASSPLSPQDSDGGRSTSRSRRRLTHSLGTLLHSGKKERTGSGSLSTGSGMSAGATTADEGAQTGGQASSAAQRRSMDGGDPSPDAGTANPTSPTGDPSSRSSKPPISLPSLFRRRHSNTSSSTSQPTLATLGTPTSADSPTSPPHAARASYNSAGRQTLNAARADSNSSTESGPVHGSTPSLVSTAPTSPDRASAPFIMSPSDLSDSTLSTDERRRRGSDALSKQLSGNGAAQEEEELVHFVAASGSSSTSPTSPCACLLSLKESLMLSHACSAAAPFSTLISHRPAQNHETSSPVSSTASPSPSGSTTPPAEAGTAPSTRRLNRNVVGLSLSNLRSSPPLSPPSDSAVPFLGAPVSAVAGSSAAAVSRSDTPNSRTSSQRERLGALPRLLSTHTIPAYRADGDEEQEADPEESETDTDEQSSSSDEGERYATSDEGPVTTRSRDVTPAHTPGALPTPRGRPSSIAQNRSSRMPSLTSLSAAGEAGPSGWVSFAPSTPTASIRTARLQAKGDTSHASYFDIPRPSASTTAKTPLIPPQTPLAPMSISDVARGKRPAWQEDVDASAAGARGLIPEEEAESGDSAEPDRGVRAGLYRMRSQSVVALASPSMVDDEDQQVGTAAITGLDPVWQRGVGPRTPGPSFLSLNNAATQVQTSPPNQLGQSSKAPLHVDIPPPSGAPPPLKTPLSPSRFSIPPLAGSPQQPSQPASPTASRSRPSTAPRLHRPRSMYELRDAPPAYSAIYRRPGLAPQIIQPREEEGNEGLPGYSCAIHIEGYMPRKMEFTAPGVQAKDRAWKRQYIVLHGTSIKIYRSDLRTHPIAGEEDWSVIPADIAGHDGPPPLHFHEGEYGVDASNGSGIGLHHKFPLSIGDAKAKAKARIVEGAAASAQNQLVRHYSLQNAESGLAADYLKRKHVVRVRAEGEQFLLQAKDDRGVIDLIEALQAATNVALDLDARPLPKFITLPRRRRRRRPRPDAANGTANAATGAAATTQAASAGRDQSDRMGDMLAEEQNAYSRRNQGTVM